MTERGQSSNTGQSRTTAQCIQPFLTKLELIKYHLITNTNNWRTPQRFPLEKNREKDPLQPCCSLLTILVLFLVLLGVLAVSGLALYIGALRLEPTKTLLIFDGNIRLLGDRFSMGLANQSSLLYYQKSQRYQTLLEAVFGKSQLGLALHEVIITGFANGSLIIFFKIILDRRKIPKHLSSLEDTLKTIILDEASSPLSVLNSLKVDPKQFHIKRYLQDKESMPNFKEKTNLQVIPKKLLRLEPSSNNENLSHLQKKENTNKKKSQPVKEEDWHPFNPPKNDEGRGFVGEAEVLQEVPNLPIVGEFPDIVTLLPVRSNVGVRPALRPKPPRSSDEEPEIPLQSYFRNDYVRENSREREDITGSTRRRYPRSILELSSKQNQRPKKSVDFPSLKNFTLGLEAEVKLLIEGIFQNMSSKLPELTTLAPETVKEIATSLDKLAKLKVSHKAVTSSHHSNVPFTLLTKVFNKAPIQSNSISNVTSTKSHNSDCGENYMLCKSGECIPVKLRCNRLADCRDSSDEKNCTCAELLKSQLQNHKICDGINDCADLSDETGCVWCSKENQYRCSSTRICIHKNKICDGFSDCPNGDDESQCISLRNISSNTYYETGNIMLRKNGLWGKLCLQNFGRSNASWNHWELNEFAKSVCAGLTFKKFISITQEKDVTEGVHTYYEVTSINYKSTFNQTIDTRANYTFEETKCPEKEIATLSCEDLTCGLRSVNKVLSSNERKSRIVGGGNANPGSWPWQAALYKEGEFQCGGTLITDKWVISAAHCFYRAETDHWVARLGVLRRGGPPSLHEQIRRVSNIVLHPSYQDLGYLHDISLLKLESPLAMTAYVRPICLPNNDISSGQLCTVIGWGQLSEDRRIFPDTLQEVQVPIISTAECRKRTGGLPLYRLTDDMFCAGFERGGRDACLGDSGGPLMCEETDNHWTLHGVTSNGYGCARANRPGIYTKVKAYLNWIDNTTQSDSNANDIAVPTCTGHRCPLGECLPQAHVCNGYTECSDSSDEAMCW